MIGRFQGTGRQTIRVHDFKHQKTSNLIDKTKSEWANLLHFTKGQNNEVYGDRTPGIWLHVSNTKRLLVAFPQNGNKNFVCNSVELSEGSWNKIEFSQYEEGGIFYQKLLLNGNRIGDCQSVMSNSSPRKFENLKVYQGDPWYTPAANAKLRNVMVWSSAEKMKYGNLKCDDGTGKC